jgi:hypothetical protein
MKPTPEQFGWEDQQGPFDEPSGWKIEGGEEAYEEALRAWEEQMELIKITEQNYLEGQKIRNKSSIPNTEGYELIAVNKDGSTSLCTVKKDELGCHYIDNYKDIIGWLPKLR